MWSGDVLEGGEADADAEEHHGFVEVAPGVGGVGEHGVVGVVESHAHGWVLDIADGGRVVWGLSRCGGGWRKLRG